MNRKTIQQHTNIKITNGVSTNSPNSIRIQMICLLLLMIFTMIGCKAKKCENPVCSEVMSRYDEDYVKGCFEEGSSWRCDEICTKYIEDFDACENTCNLEACTKACDNGRDSSCEKLYEILCKQNHDEDACARKDQLEREAIRRSAESYVAEQQRKADAERIANLPKIVSTEDLGQLGTKAQDGQWLILVGMVDEVKAGSGGNFFVFAPKMNLTQNSREIRCTVKHDGRAKQVKVGDVITISGVNKYNKYHDFIAINDCRFHGYDNQADNALRELTGTNSSN